MSETLQAQIKNDRAEAGDDSLPWAPDEVIDHLSRISCGEIRFVGEGSVYDGCVQVSAIHSVSNPSNPRLTTSTTYAEIVALEDLDRDDDGVSRMARRLAHKLASELACARVDELMSYRGRPQHLVSVL